jgi:pimeloyl-ACP methyl ester carboxylesterase
MAHRWVDVHGLRLHCVEAGTGPLVVLLHGFPEFWYAWRHQLPALADAGYRVVAPDLPGYNTSDKPPRVRDYRPQVLAQDMADLIVALGAGSAAVAGHDWGGALAWLLAMHHPERVQRLVVLNAPIPSASSRA